MPIYLYRDEAGHEKDIFCMHPDDKGCQTALCKVCGATMAPVVAYGQGLCYFEEGRERRILNLETIHRDKQGRNIGTKPVIIRSHEAHKKAMRRAGVDFANRGVGQKGQWI